MINRKAPVYMYLDKYFFVSTRMGKITTYTDNLLVLSGQQHAKSFAPTWTTCLVGTSHVFVLFLRPYVLLFYQRFSETVD